MIAFDARDHHALVRRGVGVVATDLHRLDLGTGAIQTSTMTSTITALALSDGRLLAAVAGDVLAFLNAQGLATVDLVGHSMGGKTAMQLALLHPERVRRLTVVDIAPAPSESDSAQLIALMQRLPLSEMQRRSELDRALAEHVPEPGVRAFIAQNAVSRDGRLAWRVNLPTIARDMQDLLDFPVPADNARYPGPTLFVGGEHSDYIRSEHHDAIHSLFSDCRIETIRDAGHWVHAEQPGAFTALLQEFLDGA